MAPVIRRLQYANPISIRPSATPYPVLPVKHHRKDRASRGNSRERPANILPIRIHNSPKDRSVFKQLGSECVPTLNGQGHKAIGQMLNSWV